MTARQKPSLSELRVGIFVIVACLILAVAIFTIGSQVGLFEETFWATTFLNNVSGLKPGDVVLLGGVEVGNVTQVKITTSEQLPDTEINRRNLQRIQELNDRIEIGRREMASLQQRLAALRDQYLSALEQHGVDSSQARQLKEQIDEQENDLQDLREVLDDLVEDVEEARSELQNIQIFMQIKSDYRDWIRADSNISLGSIGLLGDKYIEISLGRTDEPARVERFSVESWLGKENREFVVITGTPQASFEQLITGANDILANFQRLSAKVEDIMDTFEEGRGTVGKFFYDPSFYNNLNATIENANRAVEQAATLMQDITRGTGTIPLLIQQREVYDNIAVTTERLESLMARIESGEGSLGRFIQDPELYEKARQLVSNFQEVARRIEAGEGTLGKLSKEEEFYRDLERSMDRLASMLNDVEEGKGTLGRLAKDEQLYANLNEFFSEVVKLIYDFRQNPKKFLTINFKLF